MKDTQIIELLKSSNYTKAGEKLYGYFPVVQKLVLRNSGSKQDAEDIYQEALIILVRKVQTPGFVLSSSLNTYVYGICRFLWSERLKQNSKRIEVEVEKSNALLPENETEELRRDELKLVLAEKAFLQLGEKCRQLLLLFYFKKQALKDIALKLSFATEQVAKNQKYRCLEKAKAYLQTLNTSGND